MGPLIFPCCVFSLAYYILTAPRLRNVDEFILPILQKVVKIYIHDCELQKDLMCWIFETKTYEPDKTPFISLRGSNGLEACLFFLFTEWALIFEISQFCKSYLKCRLPSQVMSQNAFVNLSVFLTTLI